MMNPEEKKRMEFNNRELDRIRRAAKLRKMWEQQFEAEYNNQPVSNNNNQSKRIDNKEEFWVIIAYASDREYKQSISIDNLEIPIVDVTPSDSLKQIAIWIKENHRNNGNDNGKSIIRKPKKKK